MTPALTVCPINNHSLLLIKGPDARKFLQGQVTCDIETLGNQKTDDRSHITNTLGAHCTHKGRVVFSFRALPLDEHTIALQVPTDIIDTATAALQKYIVFSKAEIINASAEYFLYGFQGDEAHSTLEQLIETNNLSNEPTHAFQNNKGTVLCIGPQRYELWLNAEQAKSLNDALTHQINTDAHYWDLLNINAGIAEIRQTTSGLLTPHAINFHQIDYAVSFQKGCYTGQEVVARMHYLGKYYY
jgi:folate-binding protein YgfZ